MNKAALYLPAAAILGALIVIIPFTATSQMGSQDPSVRAFMQSLGDNAKQPQPDSSLNTPASNSSYLEVLTISFAIAIVAYAIVRHRTPRRDTRAETPPC